MRLIFLGSGEFALPTLRWLAQSPYEVARVITQPARPSGRGRRVVRTAVAELAAELALPVDEVEDVNRPEVIEELKSLEARVGVVVAFGQKLGRVFRASIPAGFINLHASLLPRYRGAAPINWAIVRGEERTGCTVFRIVEKMDAGPILTSRCTDIEPDETAGELHDRLADIGVDAVRAALDHFSGDAIPEGMPQADGDATPAPKLQKSDGRVEFHRAARDVANFIRGMAPWPGAAARYESAGGRWERVTLMRARAAEDPAPPSVPPGTLDARRYVAARDRFVEVLEIKPSSGRVMSWAEYVNGRHVAAGDRLVSNED